MNSDLMGLAQLMLQAGALASCMPPLVAAVVRTRWPSWAKALVALASSVIVGTFTAWAAGELTGLAWPAAIVAAATATQVTYRRWWHPTGVAPWIEQLTNPKTIDGEVTSSETVEYVGNAEIGSSGQP